MNSETSYTIDLMRSVIVNETMVETLLVLDWAEKNPHHSLIQDEWGQPLSSREAISIIIPRILKNIPRRGEVQDQYQRLNQTSAKYRIDQAKALIEIFYNEWHGRKNVIRYRLTKRGREVFNDQIERYKRNYPERYSNFISATK